MTKKIKLGLSAMVAFAMMFATSLSAVAQENITSATLEAETEFVQAQMLANTVQKLNSGLWQKKTMNNSMLKTIGKEPVMEGPVSDIKKALIPQWFMYRTGTSPYDPTNPNNYEPYEEGGEHGNGPDPDCTIGSEVCAVKVIPGPNPDLPDEEALQELLEDNPTSPTSEIKFRN